MYRKQQSESAKNVEFSGNFLNCIRHRSVEGTEKNHTDQASL